MTDFRQRLKRRKLVGLTLAGIAAAFALLQRVDIVAQRFGERVNGSAASGN